MSLWYIQQRPLCEIGFCMIKVTLTSSALATVCDLLQEERQFEILNFGLCMSLISEGQTSLWSLLFWQLSAIGFTRNSVTSTLLASYTIFDRIHWPTEKLYFRFWMRILIENFLMNKEITLFLVCELLFTRKLTFYI